MNIVTIYVLLFSQTINIRHDQYPFINIYIILENSFYFSLIFFNYHHYGR